MSNWQLQKSKAAELAAALLAKLATQQKVS